MMTTVIRKKVEKMAHSANAEILSYIGKNMDKIKDSEVTLRHLTAIENMIAELEDIRKHIYNNQ